MKRIGKWSVLALVLFAVLLSGCTSEAEKYKQQMEDAAAAGDYQTALTIVKEHPWLFDDEDQMIKYYTARYYEDAGEYETACFIYEYLMDEYQDSGERAAALGEKIPGYRLLFDEIQADRVLAGSSYDVLWVGNVPFDIHALYGDSLNGGNDDYAIGEGPYIYRFGAQYGLINADGTAAHPAQWEQIREEGDYFIAGGKQYSETVLLGDGTRAVDALWHTVHGVSEDGMVLFFSDESDKRGNGYADLMTGAEIPGRWFDALMFKEGLAAVREEAGRDAQTKQPLGKWGFIDGTGKLVVPCEYEEALSFSEGLAAVKKDGKWGYIDQTGAVVIPFEFDKAESFVNGYAQMTKNGKTNSVSRTGVVAAEATAESGGQRKIIRQYEDGMTVFRDGMFVYSYGVMDAEGNVVIEAEWDDISTYGYSEGIFRVRHDYDYGFVDANGNVISEAVWTMARAFDKGYAVVWVSNYPAENTAGVIDRAGNVVVDPVYDEVRVYGDDIAGARNGDVWYVIDMKTGAVSEGYQDGEYIASGVARIRRTDEWGEETCGLYDVVNGKLITGMQWDTATGVNQGYCMVSQNGKYALIDMNGNIVTEFLEPISSIEISEE